VPACIVQSSCEARCHFRCLPWRDRLLQGAALMTSWRCPHSTNPNCPTIVTTTDVAQAQSRYSRPLPHRAEPGFELDPRARAKTAVGSFRIEVRV